MANKPKEPKAAPKPKKTRSIEELIKAATKSMTDKEKTALINHLRDELEMYKSKVEAVSNNCEKAYEQARQLQEQYNSMEAFYRDNLKYIDNQVEAFANAVKLATRGGLR